jgi:hydroxymethylpyrimidine pyrophosphatase-like HAD family hydrolase
LDVTHRHATKGRVVEFLSRNMRIPRRSIATIGDMANDVSMFKRGGVSIAMGNADKEVQAQATFVTSANDEDGFSHAIGSFVLPDHALAWTEWR